MWMWHKKCIHIYRRMSHLLMRVIIFESYISPVQNLCSFVLCLGKVTITNPINCPKMTVPAATHMAPVFLNAQVIGNAFVEQYYHVLRKSPELVYKFYNDTSILSRIDSNGLMTSLTTLKDIDEKIQSQDLENSVAEIETVDAQDSYHSGIIVVVTGSLSETDDVERKFTQTFFLAPQEKGYFVLNDVFRCVMESAKLEINSKPVDCDSDSAPTAPLASASVVPSVSLESEDAEESEALNSEGEACNLLDKETKPDMVKDIVNEQSNYTGQNSTMTVNSADSSGPLQENRSYASIVKVPKSATSGASNLRWTPTKTSPRTLGSPNLSAEPTASPPTSDVGPQSSNPQEVEGHSIYIRNLPLNATIAHVTEEFTKFGPINHGGVQVRIHKEFGYYYGFVEFQSLDSMQNAIKESPLTIGGRRVVVEEKKSTIRVGSTGNAENKFQYSNFRRRGYFGRGYGRNFRSQSKSNSESYTEYRYQRVDRS